MANQFAHTIIPWLMGGLGSLILLAAGQTIRFWRESKRSPYYFLRRQAEQNMQSYSLATLGLMVTTLFVAMYVFQGASDNITRIALIENAKPAPTTAANAVNTPLSSLNNEIADTPTTPEVVIVRGLTFNNTPSSGLADVEETLERDELEGETADPSLERAAPTLPAEYNKFEPTAELTAETRLTPLAFATEVDLDLQATNPRKLFTEGRFMLYATFEYEQMADGMVWSWLWRHEGEVINGGNEIWQYGNEGPGYVYLKPPTGFQPGEYVVEIWVNNELLTQGDFFITTDVAAQ
ncbi:MAG: hypothetical protein IPL28_12150 [Chloroflexi bacterium]|nr:hypothetical protein [Chloroflexota bacterium]